jgi:hypothetical protein
MPVGNEWGSEKGGEETTFWSVPSLMPPLMEKRYVTSDGRIVWWRRLIIHDY